MDTPLDPAQTKGRRMSPTRAPSSDPGGAVTANTYRQDRTLAETIVFRSKTAGFHSKFDHSLVKTERGTGGGYLLEKKFLSVGRGGSYGMLSENRGILSLIFSSSRLAGSRFGSRLVP